MLLIFIRPALENIGIATFFAAIVLVMVPPAGILLLYLMVTVTLMLGMCLAWAWGLLVMKVALAARPASETAAKLQALAQAAVARAQQTGGSPSDEALVLIHDGFMLDARVTVVFFVMCLAFIYALARLRCASPKLILLQIIGTIVIDLFLLIGPTLPSFNATLAEALVKPGAIGIGLGAACSLLIFPQSASYVVLRQMEHLVGMGGQVFEATRRSFARERLELASLQGTRLRIIGIFKAMEPSLGFLPVDISRGRWSATDVSTLQARVRQLMLACLFLLDFQIAGTLARERAPQQTALAFPEKHSESAEETSDDKRHGLKPLETVESKHVMSAFKTSEQYVMSSDNLRILQENTSDLLRTCSLAAKLAATCIHGVNASRWSFRDPQQTLDKIAEEIQEILENLRSSRKSCSIDTTEAILKGHAHLFDANGEFRVSEGLGAFSLSGMVWSVAVEEHMFSTVKALERLLEDLLQLLHTRRESRLWIPSRLQQAVDWFTDGEVSVRSAGGVGNADPDVLEEAYRRLRQSQGASAGGTRKTGLGRTISSWYAWLINPAGMYALRQVIVTLATSIPAVLPHTAGFFYREKGMWAVITAQTSLLFYMADFTYSLVSRLLGTIIGGLLGLVAWYMGSGHGDGNPYGMATSSGLMAVIVVWLRVFLPPSTTSATIIGGATFALIIGFSWDQHHMQQDGLPGQGFEAFWKRVVTVILGFIATVIVQLFPRTPSANSHVRKSLANAIQTLSDHYALILSHWSREEDQNPLEKAAQKLSLEVAEALFSLTGSIQIMRFELSSSPFDQESLREAHRLCQNLNQAIGRLLFLSATLPRGLQDRMARTLGLMDEGAIGSIMAVLTITEQSLRTCSPLPERMPTPLVRTCFEAWYTKNGQQLELSMDLVRDENYRRYCIAVSSYLRFLATLDDLVELLKKTLGESHLVYLGNQA
ncbi:Uncharacterized protein ESCO_003352 [Escovopsis weberi]|uniref:Protein BRE4 n=1 Tax=Escovopsis weberi TaxID=150374 RepID=A0A0M9VXG1_ESCWE|nr:Uncharacterized protein ESCO_003352 [Escovopsis weberi]